MNFHYCPNYLQNLYLKKSFWKRIVGNIFENVFLIVLKKKPLSANFDILIMKFFTEFIVGFLKLLSSKLWEKLNFERWNLCTYHSKNDLSRPDIDIFKHNRESRCLFRKILNKIACLRLVLQKDMSYLLSVSWPVIFWNFYFFFS